MIANVDDKLMFKLLYRGEISPAILRHKTNIDFAEQEPNEINFFLTVLA